MKKYWTALAGFPKFGPARIARLRKYFPNIKAAFLANASELKKAGIEPAIAEEFVIARKDMDPDRQWEKIEHENIRVMTIEDKDYPPLLKEIFDPPSLLYIKGDPSALKHRSLAIVGSRKVSAYGKQAAPDIARFLAGLGMAITSGMAIGVDSLAHNAALEAGGKTIAVLGSGLDRENIYPAANRYLAEKIISGGGAVISEFPLGTLPLKQNFPYRNRIISGLSLGTLVIEATERSGSLITAKYALDQNREVFAVPGNIYSQNSAGPLKLIRSGAIPVTRPEDIIEALNLSGVKIENNKEKAVPETKEEEILLKAISKEPLHIDKLIKASGLDTSSATATLTLMEIKGYIKNIGGMNYILS